jgi:hypothetical protein
MGKTDPRLPPLSHGLGVVVSGRAKFYPMSAAKRGLVDDWSGRALEVALIEKSWAPVARWADDGGRPFQLLTRWYGFAYTYPGCEIYGA